MLVNSVIIILREVLEAALIVSVLLALSQKLQLSKSWLTLALIFGLLGATIYALNIQAISQAFEGVGQEVLNATIHIVLWLVIALFIIAIRNKQNTRIIYAIMMSCVALAITREGSEIIIYIQGLITIPELMTSVIAGSIIGSGIGVSIGVFFYYFIDNLSFQNGARLGLFLIVLIAGGMVMQITQLLIQADIINSQHAIWNTSSLLNERSLIGQLLYAVIGYEATPTPTQIYAYIFTLIIMLYLIVRTLSNFKHREYV